MCWVAVRLYYSLFDWLDVEYACRLFFDFFCVISASMSMLAEPKRKQKFGPDPRNTFWSNDESKFGFRMLESMGWKKGKGLGAKESGMTEHLTADNRKNTDVRGLGCSRKHADNWIAHQDDFNAILASLNNSSEEHDASSKPLETTEGLVSLEEKSKTSRSRVHYHKFTRAKDLSSRSAEDLNCIFGRRKRASSDEPTPKSQSEINSDEDTSSDNQDSNNNGRLDKDLHAHGVKTITSSSSVQEYFAMKMAELTQKRGASDSNGLNSNGNGKESENSSNSNSRVDETTAPSKNGNGDEACEDSVAVEKHKRKKKKKKDRREEQEKEVECKGQLADEFQTVSHVDSSLDLNLASEEKQPLKSKRKERKKRKASSSDSVLNTSSLNNSLEESHVESETKDQRHEPSGKKAKKRKSAETSLLDSTLEQKSEVTDHNGEESLGAPPKKKKRKRKEAESESQNSSILRLENDGKTRRRKSVRFSTGDIEVFMIPNKEEEKLQQKEEEVMDKKSSKKRKRRKGKTGENEELETIALTAQTEKEEVKDSCILKEEKDSQTTKKKHKSKIEQKESRKKKSKALKEDHDVQGEQAVKSDPVDDATMVTSVHSEAESDLVAQPGTGDDTPKMSNQQTEAESSVTNDFSDSKKMRCKSRRAISRDQADIIYRSFVNSNLSSVKGYGCGK